MISMVVYGHVDWATTIPGAGDPSAFRTLHDCVLNADGSPAPGIVVAQSTYPYTTIEIILNTLHD
jgi:hypothetical protein